MDFLVAFHDFISFGILYHRLPVEGSEIPPTKFTTAYTGVYSVIYPAGIVTFSECADAYPISIILDIPNRTTETLICIPPNEIKGAAFWTASEKQIGVSPGIETGRGEM